MPDLSSLLASADDLRVDALAQEPWCAQPDIVSVRDTYELATERGYDILPMRDSRGQISTTLKTSALRGADSWDVVLRQQEPLTPERLVARESPVLRLLDRLGQHAILFTLGRTGVDGVVTIYDLNQPAAHLLAFGMALICEAEVTRALRADLGEDPEVACTRAHELLEDKSRGLAYWKRARSERHELHIASRLMLGEKLAVLAKYGIGPLAEAHGVHEDALLTDLREVCALRNAIAHYDVDDDRLADPHWTFERMRLARRFAARVAAPGLEPATSENG